MKNTLVIGASLKEERYSYKAIHKLRQHHHEVKAIGSTSGKVLDVDIKTTLIAFEEIDTVTLYLNPKRQESYYEYIVSLRPKRVLFNPGTENSDFYHVLEEASIAYEEACTLVLLSTNQY